MQLVVTDTNIIIDLDAGGLLEDIFCLPNVEFCVPDVLYVEELADAYGILPGLGLKVLPQPPEAVGYVEQLRSRFKRQSSNDLFALALARTLNGALLAGDCAMSEVARAERIKVHGMVWLMEQLLVARIIPVGRVASTYEVMQREGCRLSWIEASAQVLRWQEA
jgi:hypothetical protein